MTINENNEEIFRIFNTPKNLNLSKLFPTYTEDRLNKVRYIIHQCNYYSTKYGYNLHTANHAWFLSLTKNEIAFIIDTLVENKVIQLSVKGAKGKMANHYKIVTPYNYHKEDTVNKHFFDISDVNCPLWYQRYVADGGVRNAETTSWIKRPANWKPEANNTSTVDKDAYIKLLEQTLLNNGIELPVLIKPALQEPTMAVIPSEPELIETPEQIIVTKGDKSAIITNYQLMAGWYDTLTPDIKRSIESHLVNAVGSTVPVNISNGYNVYFNREVKDGFTYVTLNKVFKDNTVILAA
jgi:hypothetical protein